MGSRDIGHKQTIVIPMDGSQHSTCTLSDRVSFLGLPPFLKADLIQERGTSGLQEVLPMHSRLSRYIGKPPREGVAVWFPNIEGFQSRLITQAFWNL